MQYNNISSNPNVQETINRYVANQDLDCRYLQSAEVKLMKAVFMEALHDASWTPTHYVEQLLIEVNNKLKYHCD